MRLTALVAALLLAGCYNPKIPSGSQLCAGDGTCAKGYTCGIDKHCYLPGQLPAPADLALAQDLAIPVDLSGCTPSSCAAPLPFCNLASGQCVACLTDPQCGDGQLCVGNQCAAGCSMTHGCGDAGACEGDAGQCKTCKADMDCGDPQNPRCEVATGRCVACQPQGDNCGAGQFCVQTNGVWQCMMGCKVDLDCMQSTDGGTPDGGGEQSVKLSCCNHLCVDLTSDNANCGKCSGACANHTACCAGACSDTTKDLLNCGACSKGCAGKNAVWTCTNSACAVVMCNGTFRDCNQDPSDGCEVNIVADPMNCLACGKACALANATPVCAQSCGIGTCNMGFADCNKKPVDGCEVNTGSDVANCGECGKGCGTPNNGTAACKLGVCGIAACNMGFGDCDMTPGNGCEANLQADANNCSKCGMKCPVPMNGSAACMNGVCGVSACMAPFKDCNMNPNDGCEVNSATDVANCNQCGHQCPGVANGTPACKASICGIGACNQGLADCDNNSGNGCEANLNTDLLNCKSCGNKCPAVANGTPACANGNCGIATCTMGFADCNSNPGDGCEATPASDAKNCGACGKVCPNNQPYCLAGNCTAVLVSCLAIKQGNPNAADGTYTIDPDGGGPLPSVQVYCDMAAGGQTVYMVHHNWGEWGANMTMVMRDLNNPATGSLSEWQANCALFGKANYSGSWHNTGQTYSLPQYAVFADSKDWWNNYALKVFPSAVYNQFLILQDSNSPGCWAWYAEAGSLESFGSPAGSGYAFCRGGQSTTQRYHIYICLP